MTQEEILEYNQLIAVFDGKKIISEDEFNKLGEIAYTGENSNIKWGIIEYLAYHLSYDEIMPVVEKIRSLNYSVNLSGVSTICHNSIRKSGIKKETGKEWDEILPIAEVVNGLEINQVHSLVVQFIKWYNTQNK